MPRQTYVIRNGELVPKHQAAPLEAKAQHRFMRDIQPFLTQDGTEISSRSKLRAYEQQHGVRQVGNDWVGREKPHFWDAYQRGELTRGR